jgi:hypothetical protein
MISMSSVEVVGKGVYLVFIKDQRETIALCTALVI